MQYRFRIPVCGAIILNTNLDKCVLVKGWSSKSGWGFPKGKINQDEEYDCCAIREVKFQWIMFVYVGADFLFQVLEETGYDIGPLLKKPDYIELTMREQRIRLYIIQGVPEDTQFIPRTRKEISVSCSQQTVVYMIVDIGMCSKFRGSSWTICPPTRLQSQSQEMVA